MHQVLCRSTAVNGGMQSASTFGPALGQSLQVDGLGFFIATISVITTQYYTQGEG